MRIVPNGSVDWTQRIAFPVAIKPTEDSSMFGEKIHMTSDPDIADTDTTQYLGKQKVRAIQNVFLPRIMYLTEKNLVELDGRQYYLINVVEPKPKKNPEGSIYLLDLQTGNPVRLPFMQYASQMVNIKRDMLAQSITEFHEKIRRWNDRVEKIKQVENPSTWPLQLVWAVEVIDDRLAELDRQKASLIHELDQATNVSPSLSSIVERIKDDIRGGVITNQQDLTDNLMWLHYNDPDAISGLLELPTIPADVKAKVKSLIEADTAEMEAKKTKEQTSDEARQERIEQPLDYGLMQPEQQTGELSEQDIQERWKRTHYPKAQRYFSPGGRAKQIRKVIMDVSRDKAELTEVRKSLDGLRDFIGHLGKGERASAFLRSTDRGQEIMENIRAFAHKAKSFMRRYAVDVFIDDADTGKKVVNPRLFGTTGGSGNAEVAVVVNQIYSIVTASLKNHVQEPVAEPAEAAPANMSYAPQDGP